MAVIIEKQNTLFTLQTNTSMYQIKRDELGVLLHTYYGKKTEHCDYSYLISHRDHGFSGNPHACGKCDRTYSLDILPQEYPCFGSGDFRESACKIRRADGSGSVSLRYDSYKVERGKYEIPGLPAVYALKDQHADTLVITLKDESQKLLVHLYYGVIEEADIITRSVRIENQDTQEICLERALSANLDILYGEYDLMSFYGRHEMERVPSRVGIHHGIQSVGSTRGSSSHQYNPFFILAEAKATEQTGECFGFSFLYSGDFIGIAEQDQMNQTRVLMGIHPGNFEFRLSSGEVFCSPETVLAYSGQGLQKLSQIYHRTYRNQLCRGNFKKQRRPVLINNWEGTYFDFTGEKLVSIARDASKLGIELFVMDDGWFGIREDDNSGLGDWTVNEKKLGCTLQELSEQIHEVGLKFGIWFEPECVSEDSQLYRAHPDWAFKVPGQKPMLSRNQLVLDFSRKEVRDCIYEQICAVLDSARIEYVKWDFNRSISDLYSAALPPQRQKETAHRYVLGLYEMLERLTVRYPDILFEGCSGGGGRFDPGMLYYTPQIWCSDDTDAMERLKIQYGTSFGYPISAVGAHISVCPNHQTGRSVPLKTRGVVAMAGTFGYELDINKMSEQEKEEIRAQIGQFKEDYFLIQDGTYYRLGSPFSGASYLGWQFVSEDQREALVSVVLVNPEPNGPAGYLRLEGLAPKKQYRIEETGEVYPGAALMFGGILLEQPKQSYDSWQYHFIQVADRGEKR